METALLDLPVTARSGDAKTLRKLEVNFLRNKEKDCSELIDKEAAAFDYAACRDAWWNPEELSLLHGTAAWDQASEAQRKVLNQLYWVAYYSQIISAEIATIHYNQTSATGLYALEDFRLVCDTLDLETAQERAHIGAFKGIGEKTEQALFGRRVFTYPMRGPFVETIIHANAGRTSRFWKSIQLRAYSLLSAGNAFIACQYFTVRGLRTLNGKMIQHKLAQHYARSPEKEGLPIPSRISHYHFLDESYHFNSSTILSRDVVKCLPAPTAFEKRIANLTLRGCQRDHYPFNVSVNGIFWHEPATFPSIYRVLRSQTFRLERKEALALMEECFLKESEGMHRAFRTHQEACESYREYLTHLDYPDAHNRGMVHMAGNSLEKHLAENRRAFKRFRAAVESGLE